MKVCLIVEGAYPYVNGGVSSWMQGLMLAMPDVEFVVQSIAASPDANLQFKYQIPSNVSEIQEVYLLDDDYVNNKTQKKVALTGEEYDAFENLMFESNPDWDVIIRFFAEKEVSLNALLSGKDFFKMTLDYSQSCIFGFSLDHAFPVSSAVYDSKIQNRKGRSVPFRVQRICRYLGVYAEEPVQTSLSDDGAWAVYQGAGGRDYQSGLGKRDLQGYLDWAV